MFHRLLSRTFVARTSRLTTSYSPSLKVFGLTSFLISARCVSSSKPNFFWGTMASGGPAVVNPTSNHSGTVIFLHGLGDTGHGWCAGFEEISENHLRYVFPHGPTIKVTLNFGMAMPAWFDIYALDFNGPEDEERLKKSSEMLKSLIEEEEKKGIPSEKIIIGGFSQGGAVALYTALTMEKKLGGLLLLSTWLPLRSKFPQAIKGDKSYPVWQAHGNADPVVNFTFGSMTSTALKGMFSNYSFNTYPGMGHSSSPKEMKDVKEFVKKCLPK